MVEIKLFMMGKQEIYKYRDTNMFSSLVTELKQMNLQWKHISESVNQQSVVLQL